MLKDEYFVKIVDEICLLALGLVCLFCVYVTKEKVMDLKEEVKALNEIIEKYETESMRCYDGQTRNK